MATIQSEPQQRITEYEKSWLTRSLTVVQFSQNANQRAIQASLELRLLHFLRPGCLRHHGDLQSPLSDHIYHVQCVQVVGFLGNFR